MSATIISEPMMITTQDSSSTATTAATNTQIEVNLAKCECCGLTEEYTPAYIERIRERYNGKWVCGLCAEAVKDEICRAERLLSTEEALNRHMNVCRNFSRSLSSGSDSTVHFISAVRHILRRNGLRSTPASPTRESGESHRRALTRSESCFPGLMNVEN